MLLDDALAPDGFLMHQLNLKSPLHKLVCPARLGVWTVCPIADLFEGGKLDGAHQILLELGP
jgi:hypothetical protein